MSEPNITGLKELQAFLDQLPAKVESNIMRSAMRQGALVMLEEAKRNVPVKTGKLRDGLVVTTRLRRGVVTSKVQAKGKHASLAHLVEYGTAAHFIKPKRAKSLFLAGLFANGVDHPGAVAKPFMRPALATQWEASVVAVGEQIKKRLTKEGLDVADIEVDTQ
jgi:HK97 gp10 family phage protein